MEEIKDKDYFIVRYNENTFVVGQITKNTMDVIDDKVIAILGNHIYPPCDGHCGNECVCIYPHPSPDFVKKWVDEANKDNIITYVMIEYDEIEEAPRMAFSHYTEEELNYFVENPIDWETKYVLKVKDDNISIKIFNVTMDIGKGDEKSKTIF